MPRLSTRPLHLLAVATATLLVAGFTGYAYQAWRATRGRASAEMQHITELFSQVTRDELRLHESVLRVLGRRMLDLAVEKEPERAREDLDDLARLHPVIAGYGVARPDGQLLIVSGIPPGRPLPNLLEQPQSAATFRLALEHRHLVPGRTYRFTLLDAWLIPLRLAIRDAQQAPRLVLALGLAIEHPEFSWRHVPLRTGMRILLVRDDGYLQYAYPVAHREMARLYASPLPRAELERIREAARHPDRTFSYADALLSARRLPRYGLTAVTRLDAAIPRQAWQREMAVPSGIFGFMLLLMYGLYRVAAGFEQRLDEERRRHIEELRYQAQHDSLTTLPNRALANDRLMHSLQRARRTGRLVGVLLLDLDNFKRINDTLGHDLGDRLLGEIATRFRHCIRQNDTVARLGGDEFLVILDDLDTPDEVIPVAEKLREAAMKPIYLDGRQLHTSVSLGAALYPRDGRDVRTLLRAADSALYQAKEQGRNRLCFHSRELERKEQRHLALENHLREALGRHELRLVYQPQIDLAQGTVVAVEALLRWHCGPLGGDVAPAEFIPVAESMGLIGRIGAWVLRQALEEIATLERETGRPLRLSVNVSAVQLRSTAFADMVHALVVDQQRDPARLELEVTESVLVDRHVQAPKVLEELHRIGVRIAIDDFGTGYSSLSYLTRLPVDTLKIDRHFVQAVDQHPEHAQLVKALITLGRNLELEVVAEGVETAAERDFLESQGCPLAQGYYLARPMDLHRLRAFLEGR